MIDPSNLIPILPEILPIVYEYFKKLGGLFKPKDKFKKIAEQPEFQKAFLEDSNNNIIINVAGDLYLADRSQIPKDIKKELLAGFEITEEEKIQKDVNFFNFDFYQRVSSFSKTKIVDKELDKYMNYISSIDILNLFEMSEYVNILYKESNSLEANHIRGDIGDQYGKYGRKFCNLYQSGYIHAMVEYLVAKYGDGKDLKQNFEPKIKHFVERSDTIFFIHHKTDKIFLSVRCRVAMRRGEDYIALHAGGRKNIKIAKEILSKIKKLADEKGYDIEEEDIKTKTKTRLLNVYITKLSK